MGKRILYTACALLALCFILSGISYAAEKEAGGSKMKSFWQKLFNYPAAVTEKSADVVTDTATRGTKVVTKEVERVGEVTSGEVAKTKELVTEPVTGSAETVVEAVKGTANVPVEAAKEAESKAENQ